MKLPNKYQWWQFLKAPGLILTKKEKVIFFLFLLAAFFSFVFLATNFYLKNTEIKPAQGGVYIEGLIGSPRLINPLYAPAYDVDRDLSELVFSGLMKYNQRGELLPDLAKDYKILEQGSVFIFDLKEDLFWSDGEPLTANDIIFTIEAVQKASLKSPIRASWLGVKAEKISELAIRFELKNPSAVFLENCTLKIMPKHIWENISDQNFTLSAHNLKPVGSGPYQVEKITQDREGKIKSLELETNPYYHQNEPNISKITFHFFDNEKELISAFLAGQIKGISPSPENYRQIKEKAGFADHRLLMPRYFAVFFNPDNSEVLANEKIRQALNYGTNKQEIIEQALFGQGTIINSPILPATYGFEHPEKTYQFDPERAKEILDQAGFLEQESGFREKFVKKEPSFQFKSNLQTDSEGTEVRELQKCLANPQAGGPAVYPEGEITGYFGEKTKSAVINFQEKYKEEILTPHGLDSGTGRVLASTRDKLNSLCASPLEQTIPLSLSLTTVNQQDQPTLLQTALILKEQWQQLGLDLEIKTVKSNNFLEEVVRPRDYEMLLFGQMLALVPDPFPFWHSLQTKDPGLNLAAYESKEADKLLEEARQTLTPEERKSLLEKFQNIIIDDAPALFLYSPDYVYLISKEIKGVSAEIIVDPSKRFSNIENWYIKTKRAFK